MKQHAWIGMVLATLVAIVVGAPARADGGYPTKVIKLVVGFPPGGPTDVIGRIIAKGLENELGQAVIVENMGGAGGILAAGNVARATSDGYTLMVSVESQQTRAKALYRSVPYDEVSSFTLIRKIAKQRIIIVSNPNLPFSTLDGLVSYAKAHPDELNYGGTVATSSHIGGTVLEKLTGIKLTFVGYAGGNQLITDLMGGTTQVGFYTEAVVGQLISAGKLKALAVAASERSPNFSDIPTVQEVIGKPMDVSPWFALVGPANMPHAIVEKLEKAVNHMVADEKFDARLSSLGASPIKNSSSETFPKEVKQEIKFWNAWAIENKMKPK